MNDTYIHLSNGTYFGFISNDFLYTRDGAYIGWVEKDKSVWDKHGKYRGHIVTVGEANYIFKHKFLIAPIPKTPRVVPATPAVPPPAVNRVPIIVPLPYEDAFQNQLSF
jgi:hypothetical protein